MPIAILLKLSDTTQAEIHNVHVANENSPPPSVARPSWGWSPRRYDEACPLASENQLGFSIDVRATVRLISKGSLIR